MEPGTAVVAFLHPIVRVWNKTAESFAPWTSLRRVKLVNIGDGVAKGEDSADEMLHEGPVDTFGKVSFSNDNENILVWPKLFVNSPPDELQQLMA